MNGQPSDGAVLIPPNDPSHPINFDRFRALIPPTGLTEIETTLAITSPNDSFRNILIRNLWRFYNHARPGGEIMFSRAALIKELRRASSLADDLKKSATPLWKTQEPAVLDALFPFALMEGQPMHPSGIVWIGLLERFASVTKQLAQGLASDPGGPRRATALDLLLLGLSDWYGYATLPPERFFAFVKSVVEVLRVTERALHQIEQELGLDPTQFKLPASTYALRKRLSKLGVAAVRPGRPKK
jgi:hypothetical protein